MIDFFTAIVYNRSRYFKKQGGIIIKRSFKITALLLAAILTLGSMPLGVSAADAESLSGTFKFLNYNIAGLPSLKSSSAKSARQKLLGEKIKEDDFDIIAVQEDFSYDKEFSGGLAAEYRTYGKNNVVTGDGLNVFSKRPLYNEYHEGWDLKGGMIWEGDIISQKGFMLAVAEIAPGVYVDVYDLHADAYDGQSSRDARRSNYNQVIKYVEEHSKDHAVIITGDFNCSFHFTNGEGQELHDLFIDRLGMSDSWTNVVNNGSFTDYSGYTGSYWGNWDSVEYVLYKSSESLTLEPLSHEYIDYKDDEGNSFSDHSAAAVEFEYTSNGKTADYELKAARRTFPDIFNAIKVVFADLKYAFSHFEDVIIMIKYANDEQYLYENYLV